MVEVSHRTTHPTGIKHRLQDMSWAEFRDRLAEPPVMLLPMGTQEEQGPNVPMDDFVLAERIADAVSRRTGAVMAPVLPFGDSEFFRSLPGCMSLRPDTLVAAVRDLSASLLDHGLRHLVILNGQTRAAFPRWISAACRSACHSISRA